MHYLMSLQIISSSNQPIFRVTYGKQPEHIIKWRKEAFPRIDVIWAFLTKMKSADGCRQRFANLARIAQLVLVLPHSNAGEERIFSLVRLNKTSYRSSLSLDGTLSSILTIKTHIPDSFIKFDPPKEMLEKAKKATTEYNKKHRKEPAKT